MKMLALRSVGEKQRAMHHWGLYTTRNMTAQDGEILDASNIFDVLKTVTAQLLMGGGPGTNPLVFPPGVGAPLPTDPATGYVLEVHYFNAESEQSAQDDTGVELCLTSDEVESEAGVHVLGTLTFSLPAHKRTDVTSTCKPRNQTEPVHLLALTPHMHATGVQSKVVLQRSTGETAALLDQPYQVEDQRTYMLPDVVVQPGETLTATCTFDNTNDRALSRGESSDDEMCYMLLWAWPAGVLQNGATLGSGIGVAEDRDCLAP